jgi:hypothetical protein
MTAGPQPRRAVANRMNATARAWLASLDEGQRSLARRAAPGTSSDAERRRWHYTPTDHGGLTFGAMHAGQQSLAMRLVAAGLSEAGYVTVSTVMGLENVLDRSEGFPSGGDAGRLRDPGRYYLRVFGDPRTDGAWGWRLGGHHVSVNVLVVESEVRATTPFFLGANPASSPLLGGAVLRPLGATEDLARELVRSLPPTLAGRAVLLDRAPSDIVSGNLPRVPRHGRVPDDDQLHLAGDPVGVAGSELDDDRRQLLRILVTAYLGRVPDGLAGPIDLDAVHVAWAGSLEPGRPHYYRLHGPGLLVEWDNTQNDANHAHSVWRDPGNDFGDDVLAAHRAEHHPR